MEVEQLTEAQLVGRACLRCGSEAGSLCRVGRIPAKAMGWIADVTLVAHLDCEIGALRDEAVEMRRLGGAATVVQCDALIAVLGTDAVRQTEGKLRAQREGSVEDDVLKRAFERGLVDAIEPERAPRGGPLAWVGSACGIPSPVSEDYALGDSEPCCLCADAECVARVVVWDDAVAERLGDVVAALRAHAAQLQDQRDAALARRDEALAHREVLYAQVSEAREVVGEAWLRASGGDLAKAIRRKTAALEGAIGAVDRSLDVQALADDVLDAAEVLADLLEAPCPAECGGTCSECEERIIRARSAYREARAALDEHEDEPLDPALICEDCGHQPRERAGDETYCAICEMNADAGEVCDTAEGPAS